MPVDKNQSKLVTLNIVHSFSTLTHSIPYFPYLYHEPAPNSGRELLLDKRPQRSEEQRGNRNQAINAYLTKTKIVIDM